MRRLITSLFHGVGYELGQAGPWPTCEAISLTSSGRSHRSMRSPPGWLPVLRTDAQRERAHGVRTTGATGGFGPARFSEATAPSVPA